MTGTILRQSALAALAAAAFLVLPLQPAEAVPVTLDFSGSITVADPANPLGVSVGDSVSGSATYDASLLSGIGDEAIGPDDGSPFALSVTVGTRTFVETEDVDFDDFPELEFTDGQLVGLDFLVDFAAGAFQDLELTVPEDNSFEIVAESGESSRLLVAGFFDFAPVTAVPEPGMLALIGAGLAALGLLRRRRAA